MEDASPPSTVGTRSVWRIWSMHTRVKRSNRQRTALQRSRQGQNGISEIVNMFSKDVR
jgi:hypothetical protein